MVFLIDDESPEAIESLAQRFRVAIDAMNFQWGKELIRVSASLGVRHIAADSLNPKEIVKDAETACHVAREAGGDQLHCYNETTDPHSHYRSELEWVIRIKRALDNNRFVLYGQSISALSPTRDVGRHYEILVRMLDDDDKLIPPGIFLGVAERNNLSSKIDRWVIRKTIEWLSMNKSHLDSLMLCAINLSGPSVGNEALLDHLMQVLKSGIVPPEKLCFEITETAAIGDLAAAQTFITRLREIGCKFSLDDFGSGLSSFAYLKNLPVDFVKIDGAFVKNIETDLIDRATVKSIHEIAMAMGKKTIAEFVESAEALAILRNIGIDFAQGYFIDKPGPLTRLIQEPDGD
jgi:two-component system CheB/CheR fusion protein